MTSVIIYFILVGLILGGLMSLIFGIKNTSGTSEISRTIFGIQTTDLITDLILFGVTLTLVFLSVVSIFVRDLTFPRNHPWKFTLETISMATLGSCIIFVMSYLRTNKISFMTYVEFLILFLKFGLLHILLQFSGFYSSIF